ncbi:hypothetical protein M404DRAFT_153575 [Pisolithus tinctorius Marx 270]|uniref:Uncharacterized protein n=1 Tax=Pisolithus tinctorius Marx 270 TaxID=870435 RepID=A0A0C3NY17_PISTI|nr:hypothetical protein M404DRAFT_153575 [Pisolithus tinctorius Marx 270]
MPQNSQVAYLRPPDPGQDNWAHQTHLLECQLLRSQQLHTCSQATCLHIQNNQLLCKCCAPWPLSEDVYVDERGNWKLKRTFGYINNYCPLILTNLRCNNDIKINTNGKDTKDVTFYVTAYAMKKQKKSHNLSVLMASALAYHKNDPWYEDIHERNRLLLYCCINVINREAELSGPQVVAYIMGYGNMFKSHNYAPLYTSALFTAIRQMFPGLSTTTGVRSVQGNHRSSGSLFIWI